LMQHLRCVCFLPRRASGKWTAHPHRSRPNRSTAAVLCNNFASSHARMLVKVWDSFRLRCTLLRTRPARCYGPEESLSRMAHPADAPDLYSHTR
jgi:hypothetical protein